MSRVRWTGRRRWWSVQVVRWARVHDHHCQTEIVVCQCSAWGVSVPFTVRLCHDLP